MASLLVTHANDQAVLRITGEVDTARAPALRATLALLDGPIVVDCSALEFIDVAGLSALAAAAESDHVTLRHAPPFVRKMVAVLGWEDRLTIETP